MRDLEIDFEKVLDDYASCKLSRRQMLSYFNNDGYLLRHFKKKIKEAAECRSWILAERNLEVVYIYGKSRSGKTTAAKYFASKLNYDYFVSGSGEDILDGYDNEECIILDDFRGGTMKFSELLKFLDNNTGSSVKSRYYNKNINYCKVIFITSVFKPEELYRMFEDSGQEPIEQLMRRLKHHYFVIKDDMIFNYKMNENKYYKAYSVKDIYTELGINPDIVDDTSILDKFITNEETELEDKEDDTKGEMIPIRLNTI